MQQVLIIGNGIAADIIYGYLNSDDRYDVVGFSVHKKFIEEKTKFDLPVYELEQITDVIDKDKVKVAFGIGYSNVNQNRAKLYDEMKSRGFSSLTYIHPSAVVHSNTKIGNGTMILSNSVVEPFAEVGENTFIWSNCTVAHHSKVNNHCWIASNSVISGQAEIKDYVFVGVNCTIVNEVIVEEFNIIGAGSLITKNTKSKDVYLSRSSEKHRFDSINYSKFFLK